MGMKKNQVKPALEGKPQSKYENKKKRKNIYLNTTTTNVCLNLSFFFFVVFLLCLIKKKSDLIGIQVIKFKRIFQEFFLI